MNRRINTGRRPAKPKRPGSPRGKIYWRERLGIYLREQASQWSAAIGAAALALHQFYVDNKHAIHAAVPITTVAVLVVLLAMIRSAPEIKRTTQADNTGEGADET